MRSALAALFCLMAALTSGVLAQGSDELIIIIDFSPANDDFADAETLVLNQTYQTDGMLTFAGTEAAEGSDPDLTACPMERTVWYTFVSPLHGELGFSTLGSHLVTDGGLMQWGEMIVAVYSGTTLSNLVELGCDDTSITAIAELSGIEVTAGTRYYVRVGVTAGQGGDITAASYYKLTALIQSAGGYDPVDLMNGDFSAGLDTIFGGWKVKNANNGDAVVSGGFKFFGGEVEATKIVQKRAWPTGQLLARPGHMLTLISKVNTGADANFKITLVVTYSDGTKPTKSATKITTDEFQFMQTTVFFASPNVKAVKLVYGNKATTGTVTLDDIWLDYEGGLLREAESAPLALPLPGF
jgi:hypothetical protein